MNIKSPLWQPEGNVDLNIGAQSCKNIFIIYREFCILKNDEGMGGRKLVRFVELFVSTEVTFLIPL